MNKQKIQLAGLVLATGMLLAGTAGANTYNRGEVTGPGGFDTPQILKVAQGTFSDQHFFSVSAGASGTLYVTNYISTDFDSNGFPQPAVNIANLAVTLFSDGGTTGVVDAGDSFIDYLGANAGFPDYPSTVTIGSVINNLPIGNYYFHIDGDANGTGTPPFPNVIYGIYELSFLVSSAPVPESETYAMLLSGLGLVGFAARRRGV